MINFNTGKPNARYWVLKLLKDNFHPGDKMVDNIHWLDDVDVQGFVTPQGRKVLLVNKTNTEKAFALSSELANASSLTVDDATGDDAPRAGRVDAARFTMAPFAVAVLTVQ